MEYHFVEGQLLLIDKPLTWTSFDVVNKIRFLIRQQLNLKKIKVGHAGTLDPLASGLLLVCTGKMTKQIDVLQGHDKEYIATLYLGATTPSYDRETEPDATFSVEHISPEMVNTTIQQFLGEQQQLPPMFSAKKVDGQKAYIAARQGKSIDLKTNRVMFHQIEVLKYELPFLQVRILCSKGTYIRSFAYDFGKALNSGAYLHDLRRTKIGHYLVENAIEISEFEKNVKNLQPIIN